jgi:hypothetical protein
MMARMIAPSLWAGGTAGHTNSVDVSTPIRSPSVYRGRANCRRSTAVVAQHGDLHILALGLAAAGHADDPAQD